MGNRCSKRNISERQATLPAAIAGKMPALQFLLILLLCATSFAQQQTQQLQIPKEQLDAIEKEITSLRSESSRLAAQENSLIASLDSYDLQIEVNTREVILIDLKQKKTEQAIEGLRAQYDSQDQQLKKQKDYLSQRLVQAYKQGNLNYVKLLLQVNIASNLLRSYQYVSFLAKDDQHKVQAYRDSLAKLEQTRMQMEQEKRNLELLQKDSESAKLALLQNRQEKMHLLGAIQDQREMHLNAMTELRAAAGQLQRFFLGQESPALVEVPGAASIVQYKGLLNWPVVGKVQREFGVVKNTRFGTTTLSNGIEIAADEGTDIHAVFAGQVVFSEWFKGYGQCVIIAHPGGVYTLYAHNSELMAQRGQNVDRGQVIARVGSTGSLNGSSLYFEIREKEQPVNPLEWLRRSSAYSASSR